jgi:acyl-CoA reductase-like NAD-dependent aldehyde dehydrogenase
MAAAVPSIERAAKGVTSSAVLDFLKKPKQLLIGGKWVSAKSGKTFETINPANEEVLALAADGDKADVDEAVKVARKAFDDGEWSKISPHQRARYLLTIADLIEKHADELATLETVNNGMAISLARGMTAVAADTFRYYAGWATKIYGETIRPILRCSTTRCASRSASADK